MTTLPHILATAGHVDHGKSALVTALTGTDPDRLPEEKSRGMTIDLGFAHLFLPAPDRNDARYEIGVVDVPGHEDFVKNMVAGVGSIDAALLVVAADDGWMPQTEEHLQILEYLGVAHGVVALTKVDLVDDQAACVLHLRERLRDTFLSDSPIVATSVVTDEGIERLRQTLAALFSTIAPQADHGKPRLAIDRVFRVKGAGTVCTGTLSGGVLRRGQTVVVQPRGEKAHIRALQSYHAQIDVASPGTRVAINLPELEPAGRRSPTDQNAIARGDVICLGGSPRAATLLDVQLMRSSRCGSAHYLRTGVRAWMHHGTAVTPVALYPCTRDSLLPNERILVRVVADTPIYGFVADRFILRDWSEQRTIAGGVVLDVSPRTTSQSRFRADDAQLMLLNERSHALTPSSIVMSQVKRDGVVDAEALKQTCAQSESEIARAIDALAASGNVVSSNSMLADVQCWNQLHDTARQHILAHHAQHSDQTGPLLAELTSLICNRLTPQARPLANAVASAIVHSLCEGEFARCGSRIQLRTHRPSLPARLQAAGERLRILLHRRALDPLPWPQFAPDDLSLQALKFLVASGEAIALTKELFVSAEAYAAAAARIRQYIAAHGSATVSELKSQLNSSRRVMVPLLERLDREGVTVRTTGDLRILGERNAYPAPPATMKRVQRSSGNGPSALEQATTAHRTPNVPH